MSFIAGAPGDDFDFIVVGADGTVTITITNTDVHSHAGFPVGNGQQASLCRINIQVPVAGGASMTLPPVPISAYRPALHVRGGIKPYYPYDDLVARSSDKPYTDDLVARSTDKSYGENLKISFE